MDTRERKFYFMEMNTRLQVEHPISELITGVDLVELQLRVARGEALPLTQDQVCVQGHAFEARVYAEDPANNFMPETGEVRYLSTPQETPHVRIDTSIRQGDSVSVFYDPMIAKLVVWAADRASALALLHSKLGEYHVVGLATNLHFLRTLASHPRFQSAHVHTDFIPEHGASLFPAPAPLPDDMLALTALTLLLSSVPAPRSSSPWARALFSRVNLQHTQQLVLLQGEKEIRVDIGCPGAGVYAVSVEGRPAVQLAVRLRAEGGVVRAEGLGAARKLQCKVVQDGSNVHVFAEGRETVLSRPPLAYEAEGQGEAREEGLASVEGLVQKVLAGVGDTVSKGQVLLQVNVMKMLFDIPAHRDGVVQSIAFREGDRVSKGQLLYQLEEN